MKIARHALPLIAASALVACTNAKGTDDADIDVATTDGEANAMAREIPGGDFADLVLGAKIVGPQGPEVKVRLTNEAGAFADVTSYVACPKGMDPCDPAKAPPLPLPMSTPSIRGKTTIRQQAAARAPIPPTSNSPPIS